MANADENASDGTARLLWRMSSKNGTSTNPISAMPHAQASASPSAARHHFRTAAPHGGWNKQPVTNSPAPTAESQNTCGWQQSNCSAHASASAAQRRRDGAAAKRAASQ